MDELDLVLESLDVDKGSVKDTNDLDLDADIITVWDEIQTVKDPKVKAGAIRLLLQLAGQ